MQGREFLELARELLSTGTHPRHWRMVIIAAYYALLLECRDAMARWRLPPLARQQVHAQVRLRLVYAANADLKRIGDALEFLAQHRNRANYDLQPHAMFATSKDARTDVQAATDALALLDAIDGDAARRAAAIASIRP